MSTRFLVLAVAAAALAVSAQAFQRPSHCDLDREVGSCKGKFVRYGFDQATGVCVNFVYGGCQGNANNFQTMESCSAECTDSNAKYGTAHITRVVGVYTKIPNFQKNYNSTTFGRDCLNLASWQHTRRGFTQLLVKRFHYCDSTPYSSCNCNKHVTPTRSLQPEEFSGRRWNCGGGRGKPGGKERLRELCFSRAIDRDRTDYCELRCEVQTMRTIQTRRQE